MGRRWFRIAVIVVVGFAVRALVRAALAPPGASPGHAPMAPKVPPPSAGDTRQPDAAAPTRAYAPQPAQPAAESPAVAAAEVPAASTTDDLAAMSDDGAVTSAEDEVLAAIAAAGDDGITIKDLVEQTGIADRALRSLTRKLEGNPESDRASENYGEPRNPEAVRAERVPGKRPIHYRALDSQTRATAAEAGTTPNQG